MKTGWLLQACIVLAVGVGLVSCAKDQLDQFVGTYSSKGGGIVAFEKLVLESGKKVEITAMGTTRAGVYEVEGKKVKITVSGDTVVFTIDDKGCLDGGGQLGKYCKT
jgi:hypothetical protein